MERIRKAAFPIAGLGTRFLPATKAVPKEMLPLVDRPLIQYAVEEAIEGEKTGYQPPEYVDRQWDDVNEGDELPELVMPFTTTRAVARCSAPLSRSRRRAADTKPSAPCSRPVTSR